jgi:hypothetical protein
MQNGSGETELNASMRACRGRQGTQFSRLKQKAIMKSTKDWEVLSHPYKKKMYFCAKFFYCLRPLPSLAVQP